MTSMAILKRRGARDSQVAMIGLQLGNRVLQIGHNDPHLIALLAAKVGMTGQASALVADDTARETLDRAAAARGVAVDVKVAPIRTPPFAQGWFDVVVIPELIGAMRPHERVGTLQGARQVLRVGGRCLVIETAREADSARCSRRVRSTHTTARRVAPTRRCAPRGSSRCERSPNRTVGSSPRA